MASAFWAAVGDHAVSFGGGILVGWVISNRYAIVRRDDGENVRPFHRMRRRQRGRGEDEE